MRPDTSAEAGAAWRVTGVPCAGRVRAVFAGETITDSTERLRLHETRLPQVYYFPRRDARMALLRRTHQHTHCPLKGNASNWNIEAGSIYQET